MEVRLVNRAQGTELAVVAVVVVATANTFSEPRLQREQVLPIRSGRLALGREY